MGEGSFQICRKGVDVKTGEPVAIKACKASGSGRLGPSSADLVKFRREVSVLQELQEPLAPPADKSLWSEELAGLRPADIFLRLLDYSRDACGEPGPDPCDGALYVVTELAQYSLRDLLAARKSARMALRKDEARGIAKAIILVTAGLHAKGFVHLDLKPANLMAFDGRLKLIDIDGCVRVGSNVARSDSSISFSPYYCAPEWARFMTGASGRAPIRILPGLDVWSAGMTIAEVMSLSEVMKPHYCEFEDNTASAKEACVSYMKWLGQVDHIPPVKAIKEFDAELSEFIFRRMLSHQGAKRPTLAQCLSATCLQCAEEPALPNQLSFMKQHVERPAETPALNPTDKPAAFVDVPRRRSSKVDLLTAAAFQMAARARAGSKEAIARAKKYAQIARNFRSKKGRVAQEAS